MSKALKNKIKLNDVVSVKDYGAVGDGKPTIAHHHPTTQKQDGRLTL